MVIRENTLRVGQWGVAPVLALLLWTGSASGATTVDDIAESWNALQQRFNTVRFKFSGTQVKSAGLIMVDRSQGEGDGEKIPVPPEPRSIPIRGELLLDLENRRVRRHAVGEQMARTRSGEILWYPLDQVAVFNGSLYKYYKPRKRNHDLGPLTHLEPNELHTYKTAHQVLFNVEHHPLLLACGKILFTLGTDASDLRTKVDPRLLHVEGDAVHEGTTCVVVRTNPDENKRFFEYWVDAADPRRIVRFNGYGLNGEGEIWLSIDIVYRDTEYGPIPDHWTATKYSFATGKPEVYEVTLDEFEANPAVADADFDIDPPPGTRVYDATLPEDAREYVIAEPGKPDLPLGEHILQQEAARSRYWMYFSILAVVGIVAATVFLVNRRS